MNEKLSKLISLVKGKEVFIAAHWDADGVSSGALIYHLIKAHAKKITTLSKGEVFRVEKKDIRGKPDVIICTDICPSEELDHKKVIYIDHHPHFSKKKYLFKLHNQEAQSCSLMIWEELIPETTNKYYLFLTLVGYFGDGGDREHIPLELQVRANDLLVTETRYGTHRMMDKKPSYDGGYYLEIEKYVSMLNIGKRMFWSGDIPLEMLKSIPSYEPFIYNTHPLAQELKTHKYTLRKKYNMPVKIKKARLVDYGIIESEQNIQGVLCARLIKNKPILILNKRNGRVIASMRVPDEIDFNAGEYLREFNNKIPSLIGGGHAKAAGVTFDGKDLNMFLRIMEQG